MFKTDWSGRSLQQPEGTIGDYDAFRKAQAERTLDWNGDPRRAAEAMLKIAEVSEPPGHLLLGSIGNQLVEGKLGAMQGEFERYRALSAWTDLGASGEIDEAMQKGA